MTESEWAVRRVFTVVQMAMHWILCFCHTYLFDFIVEIMTPFLSLRTINLFCFLLLTAEALSADLKLNAERPSQPTD